MATVNGHYGGIRAALEKIGQPIDINDLHLAAHTRSYGSIPVNNKLHGAEVSMQKMIYLKP
ncbi:hypothetical protein NP603_13330 [Methylomonas sp. SURF-1]|uniref:Uncharacterized protein n=1 Tax=Methylomonas aurea TaxID=2952224 RepID=A0ABT1UIY8_9GAMM|nr:hypothetical protein [Methylomonas sp. SURF-1]MCQ8182097.1 hypothetical protein [Methylomonas sp. SURF-1]